MRTSSILHQITWKGMRCLGLNRRRLQRGTDVRAITTAIFATALIIATTAAYARGGGHSGGRTSYGGGSHTSSHGGTYVGGSGSSHKGGSYQNLSTGNQYGTHK